MKNCHKKLKEKKSNKKRKRNRQNNLSSNSNKPNFKDSCRTKIYIQLKRRMKMIKINMPNI